MNAFKRKYILKHSNVDSYHIVKRQNVKNITRKKKVGDESYVIGIAYMTKLK